MTDKAMATANDMSLENIIEKILGFDLQTTRDSVCGDTWVKFKEAGYYRYVSDIPKCADGNLQFIRVVNSGPDVMDTCKWAKSVYMHKVGIRGYVDPPETVYGTVLVEQSILGDSGKTFTTLNSSLDGVDWTRPPKFNPTKTDDMAAQMRYVGRLAKESVRSLTDKIDKIDSTASGFSGSAAEAFTNALKDLRADFVDVEYTTLADNEVVSPKGRVTYTPLNISATLDEYASAQRAFITSVKNAWDDWRAQPWHDPSRIIAEIAANIYTQLNANGGLKSPNRPSPSDSNNTTFRSNWVFPIKLENVPQNSDNTADAGLSSVDLGQSGGWSQVDSYAKNVWRNVIHAKLEEPLRTAAATLYDAMKSSYSTFSTIDVDFARGADKGAYKTESTTTTSGDDTLSQLTKALEDALKSPTDTSDTSSKTTDGTDTTTSDDNSGTDWSSLTNDNDDDSSDTSATTGGDDSSTLSSLTGGDDSSDTSATTGDDTTGTTDTSPYYTLGSLGSSTWATNGDDSETTTSGTYSNSALDDEEESAASAYPTAISDYDDSATYDASDSTVNSGLALDDGSTTDYGSASDDALSNYYSTSSGSDYATTSGDGSTTDYGSTSSGSDYATTSGDGSTTDYGSTSSGSNYATTSGDGSTTDYGSTSSGSDDALSNYYSTSSGGTSSGTSSGTTSGYSGMPMSPMMGGMGGGQQEKERERTTWLSEEEDVWGTDPDCAPAVLGRFDDVPTAGEPTRPTQQQPGRPQRGQTPTRQQVRGQG